MRWIVRPALKWLLVALSLLAATACGDRQQTANSASLPSAGPANSPKSTKPAVPPADTRKESTLRVPNFGGQLRVMSSPPPNWNRERNDYNDWMTSQQELQPETTVALKDSDYVYFSVEKHTDVALEFLAASPWGSRVNQVDLAFSDITEKGFQHLATMRQVSAVIAFRCLSGNEKCLVLLAALPRLQTLVLHGFGELTKPGLAKLATNKTLEHLTIAHSSEIEDKWLPILAPAPALKSLCFDWCLGISRRGFVHFSEFRSLRTLAFVCCGYLDAEGLQGLRQLQQLQGLIIAEYEEFDGTGLAQLKELPSLTRLDVNNCGITEEGIKEIASLTGLQHLSLEGCVNISDKSLEALASLEKLQRLDVGYCRQVTAAGSAKLKAALPKLVVNQ